MEESQCVVMIGAQHCLGFIDKKSFDIDETLKNLEKNIIDNKKGFNY